MKIIKLTNNFFLDEFTKSDTASRLKIDNLPDQEALDNLIALCENVLQPLREHLECPITVTSGYRSPELNKALKGSNTSQHMTGQAVDIVVHNRSNSEVADYIRENLDFDQLIYEYPDDTGEIKWVHVSYSKEHNRKEVLIAEKKSSRTTYMKYY